MGWMSDDVFIKVMYNDFRTINKNLIYKYKMNKREELVQMKNSIFNKSVVQTEKDYSLTNRENDNFSAIRRIANFIQLKAANNKEQMNRTQNFKSARNDFHK